MALEPASATDTFARLGDALEGWPVVVLLLVAFCPIAILLGPLINKRLTPQTAISLMTSVIAGWVARFSSRAK
jgi:hypothetical protein